MSLDLHTSFALAVFILVIAGGLLLLSWLHQRGNQALAQWGVAFFLGAVSMALIGARGHIPGVWSIVAANALVAAAYGIVWKGIRTFEGRSTRSVHVYAGAVVWILACAVPLFYATGTARAVLISAIGIAYSLMAAWELWRGRDEPLTSRWPLIILLIAHSATLPLRIPIVSDLSGEAPAHPYLLGFVILETVLFCICGVYLLGSLSKERLALRHEQTSLLDPLTGVANRRGFLSQGARIIDGAGPSSQPAALILFDVDRFKAVNDQYGHAAGDEVLVSFCRVATARIRRTDLFARLGGEEFGCLLPDAPREAAVAIAEQIRAAFAAQTHEAGGAPFVVTVSAGIALTDRLNVSLPSLLVAADRALYRAKKEGRNRVVTEALGPRVLRGRRRGSLRSGAGDARRAAGNSPRDARCKDVDAV